MNTPTESAKLPKRLTTEELYKDVALMRDNTLAGREDANAHVGSIFEECVRRYNAHTALEAEVERLSALAEGGDGIAGHTWKAMWNGLRGKIEEQRVEISTLEARVRELEEAVQEAKGLLGDDLDNSDPGDRDERREEVFEMLRRALKGAQ